jgi:flagellar motor switch protein FliM
MADVLSQDEVNDYIKKMGLGNPLSQDKTDERIKQMEAAIIANEKETEQTGAQIRQEKFTHEHLRGISIIFKKFARTASKSLSQKLGVTVNITVASIDQLTVDEFYRSIPVPTTLALVGMEPLKGGAIFEIDPSITFAIIDIICGRKAGTTKPCRELTDDEKKDIKDIYELLLEDIKQAWSDVSDVSSVELRPRLEKIEPDPKFIKLAPPSEMMALITLEVKIADTKLSNTKVSSVQGMMNYCIPFPVIEPILEKVSNC